MSLEKNNFSIIHYIDALINLDYESEYYINIIKNNSINSRQYFFEAHLDFMKHLILNQKHNNKIFKIFLDKEKTNSISFVIYKFNVFFISINNKDITHNKKMSFDFLINSMNNPRALSGNILSILAPYNPSPK